MDHVQATECALTITSAYTNTCGKQEVANAYAKHLAPYSFKFTRDTLHELANEHKGDFCPTCSDCVDALVARFVREFWEATKNLARRVYPKRYIPGDDEHASHFVSWYTYRVNGGEDPKRSVVIDCLRTGVSPKRYLLSIHTPLGPREGGPIMPEKRARSAPAKVAVDDRVRHLPPRRTPEGLAAAANELVQQLANERRVS